MKIATILFLLILSCNAFTTEQQVELLLPADEAEDYHVNELPINPSGIWWVVDRVDNGFDLSLKQVTVNNFQGCGDYDKSIEAWGGRTVEVPSASNPIALIRGNIELTPGALVAADFVLVEESNILNYSFIWEKQSAFVQYYFEMPRIGKDRHSFKDTQPGRYQVKIHVRGKEMLLYSFEEWDGEGDLGVRWIGDINRDGAPDVLLDTWRKYSSRTTRFFISQDSETKLKYFELANFHSGAC